MPNLAEHEIDTANKYHIIKLGIAGILIYINRIIIMLIFIQKKKNLKLLIF